MLGRKSRVGWGSRDDGIGNPVLEIWLRWQGM
jgi:hypothetical protein